MYDSALFVTYNTLTLTSWTFRCLSNNCTFCNNLIYFHHKTGLILFHCKRQYRATNTQWRRKSPQITVQIIQECYCNPSLFHVNHSLCSSQPFHCINPQKKKHKFLLSFEQYTTQWWAGSWNLMFNKRDQRSFNHKPESSCWLFLQKPSDGQTNLWQ